MPSSWRVHVVGGGGPNRHRPGAALALPDAHRKPVPGVLRAVLQLGPFGPLPDSRRGRWQQTGERLDQPRAAGPAHPGRRQLPGLRSLVAAALGCALPRRSIKLGGNVARESPMRLEPLYRISFTYPESWAVDLEGGWRQLFFIA